MLARMCVTDCASDNVVMLNKWGEGGSGGGPAVNWPQSNAMPKPFTFGCRMASKTAGWRPKRFDLYS